MGFAGAELACGSLPALCQCQQQLPCTHGGSLCSVQHRYSSEPLQVLENRHREGREEGKKVPGSSLVAELRGSVSEHEQELH